MEIVLAEVADRAGVTVKTILRHFGGRDALFDATTDFAATQVQVQVQEERVSPVGDLARAVAVVFDHYEARGDWVIRMLAQETSDARVRSVVERGREVHREWVLATFAPQLAARVLPDRDTVVDLLIVALMSTRGNSCGATGVSIAPGPSRGCERSRRR